MHCGVHVERFLMVLLVCAVAGSDRECVLNFCF